MNNQQLLINFQQKSVTRSNVNLFGQETATATSKVTAVNQMLAFFGDQNVLRRQASIFGRTAAEFANATQSRRSALVALINSANIDQPAYA